MHFFIYPSISKRDLDKKKTPPNLQVWPENLRADLEYRYIELSGQLTQFLSNFSIDQIVIELTKISK